MKDRQRQKQIPPLRCGMTTKKQATTKAKAKYGGLSTAQRTMRLFAASVEMTVLGVEMTVFWVEMTVLGLGC
jgi:hypothetical protein